MTTKKQHPCAPEGVTSTCPGSLSRVDRSSQKLRRRKRHNALPRAEWCRTARNEEYQWIRHRDIRAGWSDFLGRVTWDLFFTGTFRHQTSIDEALKSVRRVAYKLAEMLFGKRFFRNGHRGVVSFICVEAHRSGAWHVHALFAGIPADKMADAKALLAINWQRVYGRVDRSEVVSQKAVCEYVTKDMVDRDDWYLSSNYLRFTR